jgi:undecaprenyl-diphosphatase
VFSFFDRAVFAAINSYGRAPFLDVALPFFSERWLLWIGLVLFIAGYAAGCRRRYGVAVWRVLVLVIFMLLSAGLADLSCNALKSSVGRLRPFQSVQGAHFFSPEREWVIIEEPANPPAGTSFPSAHAATTMAVAVILSLLFRRANPWIYILPFMVGWSRIYLGRHFPLDVLAGWGVGFLSVLAVWWVCYLVFSRFPHRRKAPFLG